MMNKFLALVAGALLPLAIGCENQSTPGGPGVPRPVGKPPIVGQADETFHLSAPALSTRVTQGETKTATIGIKRGKNFDQDVTIKFGDLPKGVTITPTNVVLKHGDKDVQVSISAAADAAVGDFTIAATGSPGKGAAGETTMKITVVKK
jgi:uncharacterized membrane protein